MQVNTGKTLSVLPEQDTNRFHSTCWGVWHQIRSGKPSRETCSTVLKHQMPLLCMTAVRDITDC